MTLRLRQPDLATIVVLARALERDEQRLEGGQAGELERRVARQLPAGVVDRATVALSWLEGAEAEDDALRRLHQRAETAIHVTGVLIAAVAVLVGWAATLAAFYFDGSGRVNAVLVLALLVGLPGLMILPFAIAALPADVVRRIPGAGVLAAIARAVSAGRLAPLVWRAFPRDLRDAMALVSGRMQRHRQLYASLQKWAFLRWSQVFALTFQITAVVASLLLVVFTDLAFGWSTTLTTGDVERDARRVDQITSVMATPWAGLFTEAKPSLPLIEESRYFRVASEPVSRAQAARLGGWWKFVLLAMIVYGLLPRAVTLAIAHARLRAAARAAVIAGPGVSGLLRRIHAAQIETAAVAPEFTEPLASITPPAPMARRTSGSVAAVINWSGVPVEPATIAGAFPEARMFSAGGATALKDDVEAARQIADCTAGDDARDVVILVKAWEPPLMEFVDFAQTLRAALAGPPIMIVVLPVGLDPGADLGGATEAQLKLWRDKLATVGDPWLRVAARRAEVPA